MTRDQPRRGRSFLRSEEKRMARPITFQTPELYRLRLAMARDNTPENQAAYWRGLAEQARREADRLDARAAELLAK